MVDLTSALDYMHDRWVFHRDLKTSNLLMNNAGEVKVCDFGLARYYHEPLNKYSPTVVTLWYRAPEVLLADGGRGEKTEYGPGLDVWSLGCIFAEFVLRAPLLPGQGEIDQVKRTFELLGTPDEESWPGCTSLDLGANGLGARSAAALAPLLLAEPPPDVDDLFFLPDEEEELDVRKAPKSLRSAKVAPMA